MKRIDLSDNNFGTEGTIELAKSLSANANLEFLNLRDDSLSIEGLKSLFTTFKSGALKKLNYLDLSGVFIFILRRC